jgi:hypothetical protein
MKKIHLYSAKGTLYLLEAFHCLKLMNAELWLFGGVHEDIRTLMKKYAGCYRAIGFLADQQLYWCFSRFGICYAFPRRRVGKVIL